MHRWRVCCLILILASTARGSTFTFPTARGTYSFPAPATYSFAQGRATRGPLWLVMVTTRGCGGCDQAKRHWRGYVVRDDLGAWDDRYGIGLYPAFLLVDSASGDLVGRVDPAEDGEGWDAREFVELGRRLWQCHHDGDAPRETPREVAPGRASYPLRGSWWTGCWGWGHMLTSVHAGRFDPQWLMALSWEALQSLHSDDHEGRVKSSFVNVWR